MGGVILALGLLATVPAGPKGDDCMRLQRNVAAGSILIQADLASAPCGRSRRGPAIRYDAGEHAVRALRDLQRGETVERIPAFALAGVKPGQILYLETGAGPVHVRREVVAIQAAQAGQPLFVRAADGSVFSVPYPADAK